VLHWWLPPNEVDSRKGAAIDVDLKSEREKLN